MKPLPLSVFAAILTLAAAAPHAHAAPVISEIMSANDAAVLDEDGTAADWLEIFNPDTAAVNLGGWSLTDDATDLVKWIFPPDVILPPGGFLRVWASGKDRTVDPAALHTNFSLASEGEYLALVAEDSATVVSEFAPAFPAMMDDESHGALFTTTTLIGPGAAAKTLAPAAETPGWQTREFVPGVAWSTTPLSVGFGMPALGFFVEERKSGVPVTTITAAEETLNGTNAVDLLTGLRPVVNFVSEGGQDGRQSGGIAFLHPGAPEHFALRATAQITLPAGGQWTFHVNSSDGFRLYFDNAVLLQHTGTRDAADSLITRTLTSGTHTLKLVHFGGAGANSVEISAAQGPHPTYNDNFRLVGDTENGGLSALAPADSGVSNVTTDISTALLNTASSAYVRVPFVLANPADVEILDLSVAYNDGFIAYLNGTEVARRNAPETVTAGSAATLTRSARESLEPERISLSVFRPLLTAGENVIAFQAMNASAQDASFYLAPVLTAARRTPGEARFFRQATPGFANPSEGARGHVAAPEADPPHGYREGPTSVTLTSATSGAVIRFTTNGSRPTLTNGALYTTPVQVDKTTVLRAAAFLDEYEASPAVTQTYLFLNDVIRQTGRPSTEWPAAGAVNGQVIQYGMDQTIVNHANAAIGGAASTLNALRALPAVCITAELPDLFDPTRGIYVNAENHGRGWERPGALELIGDTTTADGGFVSGCGLRMRGGVSRRDSNPKHGWRVFFRNEYGAGKLRYPVYGADGAQEFDAFDIQCAQNYSWSRDGGVTYNALREIWSRDTQLAMGQPATRGRFVQLYVNGQYWGLHQIQERADASFGASYLGGDSGAFDVVKSAGLDGAHTVEATDGYMTTLPDGTDAAWKKLWTASRAAYFIQRDKNPAAPATTLVSTAREKLAAYYKLQGLEADGRSRSGGPVLLDVDNLIDYIILLFFTKNSDSSVSAFYNNERPNNFFCLRNRQGIGGFISINHDAEHTLDANGAADRWGPFASDTGAFWNNITYSNPQYLHQDLAVNPEYRLRFADRMLRVFRGNGVLSTARNQARFDTRAAQIEAAVIAESARWGDAQTAPARTAADWRTARANTRAWFTSRNSQFLSQARSRGFWPTLEAPAATPAGGTVTAGQSVALTHANAAGTIYFTTDGRDPRPAGGGAVAASSIYLSPLAITKPVTLKARVLDGTVWSPLEEVSFGFAPVPAAAGNLVVSEFCYDPDGARTVEESEYGSADFEYLELQNISDFPVNAEGVTISQAVDFTVPALPAIPPGGRLVIASNPEAFALRYGGGLRPVTGPFSGKLNNDGETVRVSASAAAGGAKIREFAYFPRAPWPVTSGGRSLVLANPWADPDHTKPASWRASALPDGEPAAPKTMTYEAWKSETGVMDDGADPWRLGLPALASYALGASYELRAAEVLPAPGVETFTLGGETASYLTISYRYRIAATDVRYTVEGTANISTGPWTEADTVIVSEIDHGDGTATRVHRARAPLGAGAGGPYFLRLRFSQR